MEKWAGGCIPTWSGCILQLSLLFCNVLVDVHVPAACPYLYICPFPLVGSQLFARGVNLNWPIRAQSGTCSSRVSNSRRRRTWSTHGRAAVCSNIIQVFYEKKWSCDHFGGFVWWGIYLALWKYDFYGDSLLPIVTRERFVKLVRWEQLWEWSKVTGLPLRSKGGTTPTGNRLKRPRIILKLRTRRNDNLTMR